MVIEIAGPTHDLHSGVHGGAFHEPMVDMIHVLSTLVDAEGHVLVDGFYDEVAPLTPQERSLYADIDFDLNGYQHEIGLDQLRRPDLSGHLQGRWREPCLSVHSLQSCMREQAGLGSIISGAVRAHVSMRLVPNQRIDLVTFVRRPHPTRISPSSLM